MTLHGPTGTYTPTVAAGRPAQGFVPNPLPPDPPVEMTSDLAERLQLAALALGRLDGAAAALPDTSIFLYTCVRQEAVLSSQIEGTQSSLDDLLLYELASAPGVPMDDVVEVSNYVAAVAQGMERLRSGVPITSRLIREIHATLLSHGRGAGKLPGEFRRTQNWLAGPDGVPTFVPPPPQHVAECIAALERFVNDEPVRTPAILKAALAHVQFETIHPFHDGNGRVGRMLITLILCRAAVLQEPVLYLSLYFRQHRQRYYELLGAIRTTGDWTAWIAFFADAVADVAASAVLTARQLTKLLRDDRLRIEAQGRIAGSMLRVHHVLGERPLMTIPTLATLTGLTVPAVTKSVLALEKLGMLREVTGRKRDRVFAYSAFMDVLRSATGEDASRTAGSETLH